MTIFQSKALVAGIWTAGVVALTAAVQPATLAGMTGLTLAAFVPPALFWHFWNAPVATMSESIQKALR